MAIVFLVPGEQDKLAAAGTPSAVRSATVAQAVRVSQRRDAGPLVAMSAREGQDIVVLQVAGGPELLLHPETARELFASQEGGQRGAAVATGEVAVPARLRWPQAAQQRGAGSEVLLAGLQVLQGAAVDLTAEAVVEHFDSAIHPGVYRLARTALPADSLGNPIEAIDAPQAGRAQLVLLHGTFSSTHGTFQRLWAEHPSLVETMFKAYDSQVYALEHKTLGESPAENALQLARALPQGAVVHLLTHSRGGLVAEVLARACDPQLPDPADLSSLAADPRSADAVRQLIAIVRERRIRVERVVRVACPARGTLLASKRLDAYLSVVRWAMQAAGVPVLPQLVDFLGAVARKRLDPMLIPGLATQVPDSALVQWLHKVPEPVPGQLRVVAGDVAGDSLASWLKTLVSDSFFWTDNDFVVQTRSMYGGAPRAEDAGFVLDTGGTVSHFGYFGNEKTAAAVIEALTQDTPRGFQTIGPLSWAGKSATGVRAAMEPAAHGPEIDKPAVFLLPGIVGSNLKVNDKRIWLSWRLVNGFLQLRYRAGDTTVQPDGPMARTYDDLIAFLQRDHEVIAFDFDWRLPMEQEAQRLADQVLVALQARAGSSKPVRMIAHSMGGLLARVMQIRRPEVWARWMDAPGTHLLMLGTPNAGSWAPMQVLSGDDTFGNTLVAFGAPFQDHKARMAMAEFPGLLQLQAGLLDPALGLQDTATWARLAAEDLERTRKASAWHVVDAQLPLYQWGVPSQPVLDAAVGLRRALDQQLGEILPRYASRISMVLGTAPRTPDGIAMGDTGLDYLDLVGKGDGRVTDDSALLQGVAAWRAPAVHGSLPGCKEAWSAYMELLTTGRTELLASVAAPSRGGAALPSPAAAVQHERSRPSRVNPGTPPSAPDALLPPPQAPETPTGGALRIAILNSDLSFIREPLLVGHYASLALTGSEAVVNRMLGGKLQRCLVAGGYPQDLGTAKVFGNTRLRDDNPWQMPRPEAVVIVGLGPEGKLQPEMLGNAVANAAVAWALSWDEHPDPPAELHIAATLIGSGGMNISAGQAAQRIAEAVRRANERLRSANEGSADEGRRPIPLITQLLLVDLYLDRATEAWRSLKEMLAANPGQYLLDDRIQGAESGLERPLESSYRGANYDLIQATWRGVGAASEIQYRLDTRRARAEVQARAQQPALLAQMLRDDARTADTRRLGRTLFRLLLPLELANYLASSGDTQIELDTLTAAIPWELLELPLDEETTGTREPWAIRTKLLRKLQTADFRLQTRDASVRAGVLILGEPACPARYPRLAGARAEARAVQAALQDAGLPGAIRAEIAPDSDALGANARSVIELLLDQPWRVVHISGHGAEPQDGEPRGVVLSDGAFLGPYEVRGMDPVPELVFVNCCFSGRMDASALGQSSIPEMRRPAFAAGLARELINIGVRCVVVTGWAVDDDAARLFATTFYSTLVRGASFIDAVGEARRAAHALGGDTWGAYQCYGDPDWRLRTDLPDAQGPANPLLAGVAAVASESGLLLALRSITVKVAFHGEDPQVARQALGNLEQRFQASWGGHGSVAEAFGRAWAALGDTQAALRWLRRATEALDGGASLVAAEKLRNLQARCAWAMFRQEVDAGVAVKEAGERARTLIDEARDGMLKLLAVAETPERLSLCGSVAKRLALVNTRLGDLAGFDASVRSMRDLYQRAWDQAPRLPDTSGFYPAMNVLAASMAMGEPAPEDTSRRARALITARIAREPDFWCVVAAVEVEAWDALVRGQLAQRVDSLCNMFKDLHDRVEKKENWRSVQDQLDFLVGALRLRGKLGADAAPAELEALKRLSDQLDAFSRDEAAPAASFTPAARSSRQSRPLRATPTPARSAIDRARDYVNDVALPAPRAARGEQDDHGAQEVMDALDRTREQAAVVGSEIVAFAEGVQGTFRQDLVNSTLLAQLAANKAVPDHDRIFDWYDAYFDALANIGWSVQNRDFAIYSQGARNLDTHQAIIAILGILLGPGSTALAMVTGTLQALQNMDQDSPWIRLFARESATARQAHFQVTAVSQGPDGEPVATLAAFALEAKTEMTQVLVFRWRTSDLTLRHCSSTVSIDTGVADAVREALRGKLARHAADYIKALGDL